jgi:hypothetical protein
MTLQEMQQALAIEIGDEELNTDGCHDRQALLSSCAGLVTIDEASQMLRFISFGV